ncbi:hypothetical protein [Rhizobium aethiopicum]|uniref:hypothetical protein n=1 Tax=Rhizobium aethiopicum TaxID=1138170 RepID=UPI000B8858D0|nr:hypothetical protein [Rhizobium aethiopicum]
MKVLFIMKAAGLPTWVLSNFTPNDVPAGLTIEGAAFEAMTFAGLAQLRDEPLHALEWYV